MQLQYKAKVSLLEMKPGSVSTSPLLPSTHLQFLASATVAVSFPLYTLAPGQGKDSTACAMPKLAICWS